MMSKLPIWLTYNHNYYWSLHILINTGRTSIAISLLESKESKFIPVVSIYYATESDNADLGP